MSHAARRSRAEAPDAAVEIAAGEVRRAFEAWAQRLVKLLVADYVPSVARVDWRQDATIEGLFQEAGRAKPRAEVLERAFTMLDKQSSDELRVTGVRTAGVIPKAQTRKQEWLRQNTDLIKGEDDLRRRVERVLEDPLNQGRSVGDIAKLLEEQAGYSTSRAVLTARDQTLKLYGQIQEERQTNAGIERYVWTTSLDERVRPDHADLDGTIQRWDDPPIVDQRTGRRGHPGFDFQCLPGASKIGFTSRINSAFRRWYSGQLTALITEPGVTLKATPNHPVLTLSGWKAAHAVQVGDCVVQTREQRCGLAEAEVEHCEAPIADVFQALALTFGTSRPFAVAPQFHGDAAVDQHVDVVDIDRVLRADIEAAFTKRLGEFDLAVSDEAAAGLRDADQVLVRLGLAAHGGVGGLRECLATFLWRAREACDVGRASVAWLHALTDEEGSNGLAGHPVALGEAFYRGALPLQLQAFIVREWLRVVRRQVDAPPSVERADRLANRIIAEADGGSDVGPGLPLGAQFARVIDVRLHDFSGHVFNLSTDSNWYVAQRLFVHNCRCTAVGILDEPAEGEAPAEQQRQTELRERAVQEGRFQAPAPRTPPQAPPRPPPAPPPREHAMVPTQAELDAERARRAAEAERLRLEREADARIAAARAEAQRLEAERAAAAERQLQAEAERQAAQQREIERLATEARALEAAREAERARLAAEAAEAEARARAEAAARTREAERLAELKRRAEAARQAEEARAREAAREAEARRLAEAERREVARQPVRDARQRLKAHVNGLRVEDGVDPVRLQQAADTLDRVAAPGAPPLTRLAIEAAMRKIQAFGVDDFEAAGTYSARDRFIQMSGGGFRAGKRSGGLYEGLPLRQRLEGAYQMGDIAPTPEAQFVNVLTHEYGHHVHLSASHEVDKLVAKAFAEAAPAAHARVLAARRANQAEPAPVKRTAAEGAPTVYATANHKEFFAEAFTAYHEQRDWLRTEKPVAYKMVEDVLALLAKK